MASRWPWPERTSSCAFGNVATGAELAAYQNGGRKVTAIAFSRDSTARLSACADPTALVWDLARIVPPPADQRRSTDMEACWQALAGSDAEKAFRAICDMSARPEEALVFFKDHVRPAPK